MAFAAEKALQWINQRKSIDKIVCTETDMARFEWLLFTDKLEGKPHMGLIYSKSHVECRESVLMGK